MNIVAFVVAFALFVGGILLMGYSFEPGLALPGVMFIGGILMITLSLVIPVHVLKRLDR
jgi:hypothetical protein